MDPHTSRVEGIDLTDEQREAVQRVAESDNPLNGIAEILCYLDDIETSSKESESSDSATAIS